jgi:hypothetical protein
MTVRLVLQSCVLPNRTKPWLILLLSCAGAFAGCARPGEATIQPAVVQLAPAPVFVSENPQSIYAADPRPASLTPFPKAHLSKLFRCAWDRFPFA